MPIIISQHNIALKTIF